MLGRDFLKNARLQPDINNICLLNNHSSQFYSISDQNFKNAPGFLALLGREMISALLLLLLLLVVVVILYLLIGYRMECGSKACTWRELAGTGDLAL